METLHEAEPLGFQDLGEDEAMLVWLYRQWRQRGPTPAVAEHALAVLLRQARLHVCLDKLFAVFRSMDGQQDEEGLPDLPLLTLEEERLIHMLSMAVPPRATTPELHDCREALQRGGFALRSPAEIPRSGRDRLELAIARSYAALHRLD